MKVGFVSLFLVLRFISRRSLDGVSYSVWGVGDVVRGTGLSDVQVRRVFEYCVDKGLVHKRSGLGFSGFLLLDKGVEVLDFLYGLDQLLGFENE